MEGCVVVGTAYLLSILVYLTDSNIVWGIGDRTVKT